MLEFNSQTAVAVARLIVTIALAVASTFGWVLDGTLLFNIIISVLAFAVLIYTWWKNNNITRAAQEAQNVLDYIKQQEPKDGDDIVTEIKIQTMKDTVKEMSSK